MRFLSGRSRLTKTLIATATILATTTAGIAVGVGIANATSTISTSTVNILTIGSKTETAKTTVLSSSWTTVGNLDMNPIVNMNHVLVRFSSQSKCQAGASDGWCTVRILVNQNEAAPADGTNFVWQWEGNNETWGARSIERVMDTFLGTSFRVTVQAAVHGGATSFVLQDWIISAEAY